MTKFRYQKYKKETSFKIFKVAIDDLYSAEFLFTAPKYRPETILYLAQQSIEKAIKAFLIYNEKSVPLTHDLDILINELPEEISKVLPLGIGSLTQYATIQRYLDGDEIITPNDIQESIAVAKKFLITIENTIHKP
ncbi:MAG TPA: HEPN domain-containing protein [Pseudobdellovibrionaceae bacterium]|nr:HEPN domain-containing protein [Pseudobdellovibrionaceae bacterium]